MIDTKCQNTIFLIYFYSFKPFNFVFFRFYNLLFVHEKTSSFIFLSRFFFLSQQVSHDSKFAFSVKLVLIYLRKNTHRFRSSFTENEKKTKKRIWNFFCSFRHQIQAFFTTTATTTKECRRFDGGNMYIYIFCSKSEWTKKVPHTGALKPRKTIIFSPMRKKKKLDINAIDNRSFWESRKQNKTQRPTHLFFLEFNYEKIVMNTTIIMSEIYKTNVCKKKRDRYRAFFHVSRFLEVINFCSFWLL